MIERQVHHLVRLVDDLLDVSRITRGKIELRASALDLRPASSARAVEAASPLLEQRRHRVCGRAAADAGLWVDGDPTRLAQVVANLLTNAAKYTPPGGHIAVERQRDGDEAVLQVRDDGIGIAAELLARSSSCSCRATRHATARRAASGSASRSCAAWSNCTAARWRRAATASATAASFASGCRARTPATGTPPGRGAAPARRAARRRPGASWSSTTTSTPRRSCADALEPAGPQQPASPTTAPPALGVAAEFTPDVVFLDIGLPEMDGYELAGRMRIARNGDAADLRLIALTGYGQEPDRQRARTRASTATWSSRSMWGRSSP